MVDDAPTDDLGGPNLDVSIPAGSTHEDAATNELVPRPISMRDRAMTLAGRSGDRYRLGNAIAAGGMGEIVSADDDQIGREVAIKRMKERNPSQHAMGRFFREACIQGRLDHPAIVPVHELGVDADGRPFFAMKRLSGTTLTQRIANGEPRPFLLRAFADVCLAIAFAHKRGVVHRDIKPDNIVLGDFGEVYVLDWGVAKVLNEPEPEALRPSGKRVDTITAEPMTIDGTVIGTRAYMAPEQARAERDIDGRADVYSLGCVLFEILTATPRNPKGDVSAPVDPRPSARTPHRDIPPELDQLCIAATHHDREVRIQSPRELGERVQRYLDGDRDLALRQQLARTHLDAGRAAFDAGETASAEMRRTAMREAGRALALDPKLEGAAELVSRLMLEPPREKPPEMQRMLEADNLETLRRLSKAGALSYLGFLFLLPLLLTGQPEDFFYLFTLCTVIAVNCAFLLAQSSYRNLRVRAVRIALGNALLIALLSRLASPFLIAPAIASFVTMGLVFSPNYKTPRAAALLSATLASAVLIPWFLELTGVISQTTFFNDSSLVLVSHLANSSPITRHIVLACYVVAIVAAAAGLAFQNRKAERIVRERLHLQAWQLRQLVS